MIREIYKYTNMQSRSIKNDPNVSNLKHKFDLRLFLSKNPPIQLRWQFRLSIIQYKINKTK